MSPTVLEECLAVAGPRRAIIIPEESFGANFWARAKVLERRCYRGNDAIEAARFFRREDFLALGGFDEDLVASGEDLDVSQRARRAGFEFRRISSLIMHDEGAPTPWETFVKWRYYGRNMAKYWKKNPAEARAQYNPLRRGWLRHWRELVAAPHLTLAFLFLRRANSVGFSLVSLMQGLGMPTGLATRTPIGLSRKSGEDLPGTTLRECRGTRTLQRRN
ncbi:MAG: hypothetical protein EBQ56_02270 [Proteobacteria bacterium]|nr:hypothetical protein [Pseudomonadota bacterium]